MPFPSDRKVSKLSLPIRLSECDLMGIVHHAQYVIYLEEARIHFAKEIGIDFATVVREGFNLAVIDLQISYKRPLLFGQVVDIYCWLQELKSRGMTFNFELRTNDLEATHATAQVGLLSVSNTGMPTRIPDPYFQSLQATINSVDN
ncbi:MAG: acyl-CoA thioesterase [Anaerolineae bacterium]|nr:acyl-CoA thioesterase [Anaerolineae bacterium]